MIDPYYTGPVTKDNIKTLFVDRKMELYMAIKILTKYPEVYSGCFVLGHKGTGKTSFLNVLKEIIENKYGMSVIIVTGEDIRKGYIAGNGKVTEFRNGTVKEISHPRCIFVDNVEPMNDEYALEVYKKLYEIREKSKVKIVITDRPSRPSRLMDMRRYLSTDENIVLGFSPLDLIKFLEERLKRLNVENRFEKDALELASERALHRNLYRFFRYCGLSATTFEKDGEITREIMKDSIVYLDLGDILEMKISREEDMKWYILYYVVLNRRMSNGKLMEELRNTTSFSNDSYYRARHELEENGFIRVEREGRETVIMENYSSLGIEIDADMIENPEIYREKILEKYLQKEMEEFDLGF